MVNSIEYLMTVSDVRQEILGDDYEDMHESLSELLDTEENTATPMETDEEAYGGAV
jgi:hypothetical protein